MKFIRRSEMSSLLNTKRPPIFCPGCSHDRVVHALDASFQILGLKGHEIVIVTDIGCSGLFDTFFNTHALHGLHGRALTYATGIKLARPELTIVTIMGDGGLGIGGAHVLAACRKNLDITLLVLSNFNYGMTGGQCSATTPVEAATSSHFLGQLEAPLDICEVAVAAGASWVSRTSATDKELSQKIVDAIRYEGFSLMDITGICPGRFSKRNKRSAKMIGDTFKPCSYIRNRAETLPEYGQEYRQRIAESKISAPITTINSEEPLALTRSYSILFLGAAGQRINTAAEVLCLAAMHGSAHVTQKSDYPITVLRGHSVSEVIISPDTINYTGITKPDVIVALAQEGVVRRKNLFGSVDNQTQIIAADDLDIPETDGIISRVPFKAHKIPPTQSALASLTLIAEQLKLLSNDLLIKGLQMRFKDSQFTDALKLFERCALIILNNNSQK